MRSTAKSISCWVAGLLFILAGANHFRSPQFYVQLMPDYLPWHLSLVYVSGLAEMVGGAGLLIRKTRPAASWFLILLLLAVFPANVDSALNGAQFKGKEVAAWILWARLPLQGVLIAWIYLVGKREENSAVTSR